MLSLVPRLCYPVFEMLDRVNLFTRVRRSELARRQRVEQVEIVDYD
jgi:hypothetical protein